MINKIKHILDIFGYISTIIVIIITVKGIILWVRGILPVLLRLGNGLAKSRIAIFAKGEHLSILTNLLKDSGLFTRINIIYISDKSDIGRSENVSLYLVFWHDWENDIDDILSQKKDRVPLIIYSPPNLGRIPDDKMRLLNEKRNTIVTNFRGRLLNDIMISLITGSYEK
ncbi:hypothetical protein [Gloeothece verrucosa]|uniref:Uncharacterized protein n=1 Tax=Gloeothece verrucosa (strain PCC 7822) TaxID=497965 RepID=E0UMM0_GLOV7|nr:hypothetical protein [Gloeothece verrucosa]ADN18200.1 conserved hypothetical protein [Gloeothece verrucosa PCC 7822]